MTGGCGVQQRAEKVHFQLSFTRQVFTLMITSSGGGLEADCDESSELGIRLIYPEIHFTVDPPPPSSPDAGECLHSLTHPNNTFFIAKQSMTLGKDFHCVFSPQ